MYDIQPSIFIHFLLSYYNNKKNHCPNVVRKKLPSTKHNIEDYILSYWTSTILVVNSNFILNPSAKKKKKHSFRFLSVYFE